MRQTQVESAPVRNSRPRNSSAQASGPSNTQSRNTTLLDNNEYQTLQNLAQNTDHPQVKELMTNLIAGQKADKPLTGREYDFLLDLSFSSDNPELAGKLYKIAQKRRARVN